MLTENQIKEHLSLSYAKAVATIAGFSVEPISADMDSVDVSIRAKGKLAAESLLESPVLDIQLKATQNWDIQGNEFKFKLSVKNYTELSQNTLVPRLLVVLLLPKNQDDWFIQTSDSLCLKKCAYYHNLKDAQKTNNQDNITVTISTNCVFTPNKLLEIMTSISKRQSIL